MRRGQFFREFTAYEATNGIGTAKIRNLSVNAVMRHF